MKTRKLTEEQKDRKLLIIMSLIGTILIINIFAYNLYQEYFKYDNFQVGEIRFVSDIDFNETCLCSTKCAIRFCIRGEELKELYKGDSFIVNNNLTEEHCWICDIIEGAD